MKKAVPMFMTRSKYDTRLIILYVLNITDYLFTLILISSGLFVEANPILQFHIDGILGFVLKCVVPLILLSYLHIRFLTCKPKHEKIVKILLNAILIYYVAVNIMHIFWLTITVCMWL